MQAHRETQGESNQPESEPANRRESERESGRESGRATTETEFTQHKLCKPLLPVIVILLDAQVLRKLILPRVNILVWSAWHLLHIQ